MNIHLRIQSLFNDKLQNPYFLFLYSHTHRLGKCPSSTMVFEITVSAWVHLSKSDSKSLDTGRYVIKSSNNKSISNQGLGKTIKLSKTCNWTGQNSCTSGNWTKCFLSNLAKQVIRYCQKAVMTFFLSLLQLLKYLSTKLI